MDETKQVRQMYELLRAGRIEAATELFEEYLCQRVKVGDEQMMRRVWARLVAERTAELAAEQEAREQQAKRRRPLFGRG